jgi:fucose permease
MPFPYNHPRMSNRIPRTALIQTAVFCASFVGLGLCGGALGPSLASHAARTGVQLNEISAVFIALAIGRLFGSINSAWLVDRIPGNTLIGGGIAIAALTTAAAPLIHDLPTFLAVMLCYGIAANLLDVGANTLIVRVHGDKVGPYMNAMHMSFGIGGSIAPLIVGRSYAYTGNIAAAYWMIAALLVPLAIWALRMPQTPRISPSHDEHRASTPKYVLVLLGLFFFSMVAIEVSSMQWTFTFGEQLGLSKEVGAPMLSSGFWWTYSIARLLAIPLSLRIKPGAYVAVDLIGTLTCAAITLASLIFSLPMILTWSGILGMGFFIASAFPSMLNFVSSRVPVTGRLNALLFASSNIGAMVGPWTIGQLFDVLGPVSLPLIAVLGMSAALAIFVIVQKRLGSR